MEQPSEERHSVVNLPIAGDYLQAAMQYWINLNTVIWQRLAAIMAVQLAALAFSYEKRGTLIAAVAVALAWLLSVLLLCAIYNDQELRSKLKRQIDIISGHLPFRLYDTQFDVRSPSKWIRNFGGVFLVLSAITAIDVFAIYFFAIEKEALLQNYQLFGVPFFDR